MTGAVLPSPEALVQNVIERPPLAGSPADAALTALHRDLAARRSASAVAWEPDHGAWGVYRHAEVKRVCTEWETFSSERASVREGEDRTLLDLDPPRHTALRRVLAKAFTPAAIAALEPRIRAVADDLVASAMAKGTFDLVADIAYPLPVTVIAEMLGVPATERPRYRRWADALLAGGVGARRTGAKPAASAQAARAEMDAWFDAELARPGRADQDDLLGQLLSGRPDGQPLSPAEIRSFCGLLLMAGHVTTVNLIANAAYCLLRYPEQLDALRQDPSRVPGAVEEVLRFAGAALDVVRVTTKPVRLGGADIREGQRVIAWLASANRDERVFAEPDRFDVLRSPNPHLAFGGGPHVCLGAPLARAEGRIAIEALLEPLARLRPKDGEPARLDTAPLLGVSRLVLEG